jgi:DNA-binding response OmpR family regulator
MTGFRILLALTDEELRHQYRAYFVNEGFEVCTTDDGVQCIEAVRRFLPDLLVLDPDLLWVGGDGVLAVLDRDPKLSFVEVLVLGGNPLSNRLERMLAFPIAGVVFRPISAEQLAAKITSLLTEAGLKQPSCV